MEEIQKVKDSIDTRLFNNPLAQLHQRTWLIHWSLFPLFNYEAARDTLTEMLFSPAYINTIQTAAPWLLRYLTAAIITARKTGSGRAATSSGAYQKQVKDLVRVVRQEGYEYNDPLTDFVKALFVEFDFEEAQRKLGEAEEVARNDFFLGSLSEVFVDCARHLISESYCKIHQRIDIRCVSSPFLHRPVPLANPASPPAVAVCSSPRTQRRQASGVKLIRHALPGISPNASASPKTRARSGSST